jgi:DNA recombination protein RmuC
MTDDLFTVGDVTVTVGHALITLAALAVLVLVLLAVLLGRGARERRSEAAADAVRADQIQQRMASLARLQAESVGRLQAMTETLGGRQVELGKLVAERLDAVTHRLGQSMETSTRNTTESLRHLHERLALIDKAQNNLTDLSSQVSSLREVLANKQARGAFGQGRMEAIVRDGLPNGAYEFQFTLSNRTRPDCVVFLPGDVRPIVIDAKFPLEAISALRDAKTDDEKKQAGQRLRQDVHKHVNDIAERYLIPGETQEPALMFVPSESVYAELYDGFDDIIQKAYRAQVVLVSPSLLMLAIQVMQQICKDARMREAAHEIRTEVGHLMDDVDRLRERVLKLQNHFGQASDDVVQILTSADKITKRGGRIESLEFDGEETSREARAALPAPIGRRVDAAE